MAAMDFMARAIELGAAVRGRTAPNPPVGAVVVRDGRVVGEGAHLAAGRPHAEAVALARAGAEARGGSLYVSLEPCCHQGRTPPCVDAIVAAGIREVHYAVTDPDPRVAGRGARRLAAAGIGASLTDPDGRGVELLRGYLKRQRLGLPWVTAKYAMSLDGKTATRSGDARWISGEESRRHVHVLRDGVDAVMVGIGTVLADDPALTVRPAPSDGRQPRRIVVDSSLRLPIGSALATSLAEGTIVAHVDRCGRRREASLLEARGAELLPIAAGRDGRVDLCSLLKELARRGLSEVLVEGGGVLLASLLDERLIDEIACCIAPVVIGGDAAPTPVEGAGAQRVADAPRLGVRTVERRGGDVWITARPLAAAGPEAAP